VGGCCPGSEGRDTPFLKKSSHRKQSLWGCGVGLGGTQSILSGKTLTLLGGVGFGTLLGPEETPVVVFFSGCSWPGPSNASKPLGVGVVVVVGGLGCGGVLSVA
jgi:hypothetical protein